MPHDCLDRMPDPVPFPSTPSVSGTQLSRLTGKNNTLQLGVRDPEFGHGEMKWRRGGPGELDARQLHHVQVRGETLGAKATCMTRGR
ncbi:hypothetical protein P691DRAFT_811013 [Macrolepiota fuliginosa MF-IS2]|uniref:Uncharacterized protein n=1 Tax=Macrolepiota fuliginosa MF-IS2 TaxID=1400762 RepID=A0A9P5X134_9AGAR|nr:hypothetical protein P691DRAFT_811013 [Macrolepiota fuliginosa MF-IS2]